MNLTLSQWLMLLAGCALLAAVFWMTDPFSYGVFTETVGCVEHGGEGCEDRFEEIGDA